MNSNIKVVFIDIDNTLLDFNKCSALSIEKAFIQNGLKFSPQVMQEFFPINNALWKKIEIGGYTKEQLHKERFNILFSKLGINYDGEKVEQCFLDNLYDTVALVDGALDIVKYLSSKYILCTASNAFFEQQVNRLKISGLYPYVKYMFVSEELGAEKPSKAFFDRAFSRLNNVCPKECVMIGDSLTADIKGGSDYGMKTIWFNFLNQIEPQSKIFDYKIDKLSQIKSIL